MVLFYFGSDCLCLPCVFITRYLDEQKTENGKDKEQKQTNTDKEKMKEKGSFSDAGLGDTKMKSDSFAPKTDTEKPFRGSQSPKRYKLRDDFEKKMADFHKEEMDDQDKDKAKGRKESEFDDEPKFMSKVIAGASKNQEEEKSGKWEGLVYAPPGKEKQRKTEELEEESFSERSKKEDRGGSKRSESGHRGFVPEKNFRVTAYKAVQEKSSSPPPRKTSESREKLGAKGDFSTGKSSFSITREAQVNVRMDSFDEDLARWDVVHLDPQGFSLTCLYKVILEQGQTPPVFLPLSHFQCEYPCVSLFLLEECVSQSSYMFGALSWSVFLVCSDCLSWYWVSSASLFHCIHHIIHPPPIPRLSSCLPKCA